MAKAGEDLRTILVKVFFEVEEIDPQGADGKVNPLASRNCGTAATLLDEMVAPDDASRVANVLGDAVKEAIEAADMEVGERTSVWIQTTQESPLGPILLCVPLPCTR